MSYWDAYILPVPTRKYWIQRYNKRMKEQSEGTSPDTDRPLTDAERMKFIKKAQQMSNDPKPLDPGSFMHSLRNTKK